MAGGVCLRDYFICRYGKPVPQWCPVGQVFEQEWAKCVPTDECVGPNPSETGMFSYVISAMVITSVVQIIQVVLVVPMVSLWLEGSVFGITSSVITDSLPLNGVRRAKSSNKSGPSVSQPPSVL